MMTRYLSLPRNRLLLLAGLLLGLLIGPAPKPAVVWAQDAHTTAFVNVNVVPMTTEAVLANQTVIVEGDRITAIGPAAEVTVPAGAQVVDGNGAYLMPGLADMHTHLVFDSDPNHMSLYLAQGVTTIRNLSGLPMHLEWRDKVASGQLLGPTIYTSGPRVVGIPADSQWLALLLRMAIVLLPILAGIGIWLLAWAVGKFSGKRVQIKQSRRVTLSSFAVLALMGICMAWFKVIPINVFTSYLDPTAHFVETGAEARRAVIQQKATGYDFIKPYDFLSEEAYLAAMAEARAQNMYAVGHMADEIPLETILTSGQQEIAHVDEYLTYHWIGYEPPLMKFVEYDIDYASIPHTVALTKDNNVMVVSNLVVDELIYRGLENPAGLLAGPEYAVVRPEVLQSWRTAGRFVNWQGQQAYRRQIAQPFFYALIKALHDGGVPLLIGTDVMVEGILPYHLHRELELLVEAGLTPYEALEAGTKNAGMSVARMGRDGSFGTVAIGQRADLMLLEENPLENVSHTQQRLGVMVRGQWFTQAELDQNVNAFVATYDD
ncbi:MAG TPA: amidohydrolase family protein [Caldilineaceae bacterium]|nr:amidohydrolase family protein [Caldilineaceae bacterium]